VLNALTAVLTFAFLRTLGLPALGAGLAAALALLFPATDSIRFWATAAINLVGVCLFLGGAIAALRGCERRVAGAAG